MGWTYEDSITNYWVAYIRRTFNHEPDGRLRVEVVSMNKRELSLAVARIMRPEYEWGDEGLARFHCTGIEDVGSDLIIMHQFNHTTDDALGKMAVWLASYDGDKWIYYEHRGNTLKGMLQRNNPHRALAEAIVEIGGSK